MFLKLIDKIWPVTRDLQVGDRVTDLERFGTVTKISNKIYGIVQWDNDNLVVHPCNELKITRKRK